MKFYLNRYDDLLTEKQFKEKYLNTEIVLEMLQDGYFQNEFITTFSNCLINDTVGNVLNTFIEQLQENEDIFLDYLVYWDIRGKEIDNKDIIEALKES